ncbi:PepSY-like domain-containing protein [Emticicia sp. SJ17W-69]|uniref:PepSY-like domain-containing protein n=1 Tax=Emticicia sp. SJ17W-69 TaxID=3421657 RepID=UPI003EBCC295
MKNIYILLLALGWIFSACDSVKDLQPQQNMNEAVPQATVNAIRQAFPEATKIRFSTIEKNKIWQSDFEVKVEPMSAIVNNLGVITETYKVTGEVTLPDNIKSYISTNYAGATIKNASQQIGKDGKVEGYKVFIKTKEGKDNILVFDATGTLTLLITDDRNGNTPALNPPKIYFIEKNQLPDAINTYLNNKHPGYNCIKAAVIVDGETKTYSVVVSKDLTSFEYLFDEKGNVLKSSSFGVNAPPNRMEDKPLISTDLPAVIKAYLDKEFKGWTYEKGITISQNGALLGYNILITFDKKQFSLQFDATGTLIRKEQVGGVSGNSNKYQIQPIQPKDLPKVIVDFLNEKHKEFRYVQVSIITDKNVKSYWVTILKDNVTYNYTFDEKGKVLQVTEIMIKLPDNKVIEAPLEAKDIPIKAKEFLNKNYAGWVFQKGIIAYKDNKIFGYLIAIKVGNNDYYINFDADSNFLLARRG